MVVEKVHVISDLLKEIDFIIIKNTDLKISTKIVNNLLIPQGLSVSLHNDS